MIDGKILERAMRNMAWLNYTESLKEFLMYSGPKEIGELWREYERLLDESGTDEISIEEELVSIPKEQYDAVMMKAQLELVQRVNKLITLLEKQQAQ